jgi:hypothetical protein
VTPVPGAPAWWLARLYGQITARQPDVTRCEDYVAGDHPPTLGTATYRREFNLMLAAVRDNWMELVVDAVEERLHVDGFRIGDDPAGDTDAWTIWQRNQLDADSELAHHAALATGYAYALVWADDNGRPQITIEHPSQVIVAYAAGSRRLRAAALKLWRDDTADREYATVYLPDGLWRYERRLPHHNAGTTDWVPRRDDPEVHNPLGVVPVVEFANRPKLLRGARSEIASVMSTQDQINKLVCDMLVAAEFGAYRQRWAVGVEIPTDPDTGEELMPWRHAIDRLWTSGSDDTKFGEFSETDLRNYVAAIENRVQSLASRTRTPPHYLLGSTGSFPSGESLKATETGLIAKVRSRQRHFGEAWEEVIRLAFAVTGDERRDAWAAETIWADPESRTESEHVDALGKLRQMLQVPLEQLWSDAGYTPQQIGRFRQMLATEAMTTLMAQPTTVQQTLAVMPPDVPPTDTTL